MATNPFDGVAGLATAKVMARTNREAEIEAVGILGPQPGDRVLAVGIGPGVGVHHLATSVEGVSIVGIDPSAAMLGDARRRNRASIESGTVELVQTTADALSWGDSTFDGAVAVNSIQMWDPLDASLAEVARVLRSGGRLVTLTHDWAIERSTGRSPGVWAEWVRELATPLGLTDLECWRARSERGRSVALSLTKRNGR